jgi:GTP-binding protein
MHVNNLGWDDYVGRLIIGRIHAGVLREGQVVRVLGEGGAEAEGKVMRLYGFSGLQRMEIQEAGAGDIAAIAGIEVVAIGDTVCGASGGVAPLPRVKVDEPTLSMDFCVNTGPFAGKEGKYITSRHLRGRLQREAMMNVAIRVEETDATDVFRVVGRGELQLGIFVETMRREGYEVMLSRPDVVTRAGDGERKLEPVERLLLDVPEEMVGVVNERLGPRKGRMQEMLPSGDRVRLVFTIPTRGLIGWGSEFLTVTRGQGVMNTSFEGWTPWKGPIPARRTGALVADREGVATPYALFHLQPRGTLFIPPGTRVYKGMIIGEHNKANNLDVNVCRAKKLTNLRAAGKDDNVLLSPHRQLTLEQAMEFIGEDELIEVTPGQIRLRKRVLSGRHVSRMGEE